MLLLRLKGIRIKEKNTEDLPLPFAHPFHVAVDVEEGIQIPDDQVVAYAP